MSEPINSLVMDQVTLSAAGYILHEIRKTYPTMPDDELIDMAQEINDQVRSKFRELERNNNG